MLRSLVWMEWKEARGVGRVDRGQGSPEDSVNGGGDKTSLEEEGAQQETKLRSRCGCWNDCGPDQVVGCTNTRGGLMVVWNWSSQLCPLPPAPFPVAPLPLSTAKSGRIQVRKGLVGDHRGCWLLSLVCCTSHDSGTSVCGRHLASPNPKKTNQKNTPKGKAWVASRDAPRELDINQRAGGDRIACCN